MFTCVALEVKRVWEGRWRFWRRCCYLLAKNKGRFVCRTGTATAPNTFDLSPETLIGGGKIKKRIRTRAFNVKVKNPSQHRIDDIHGSIVSFCPSACPLPTHQSFQWGWIFIIYVFFFILVVYVSLLFILANIFIPVSVLLFFDFYWRAKSGFAWNHEIVLKVQSDV